MFPLVCGVARQVQANSEFAETHLPKDTAEILSVMAELSEVIDPAAALAAAEGEFISYPDSPFQLFQPYPPAGGPPTPIAGRGGGPVSYTQQTLPPTPYG
jgi:hypothetical protein